MAGVIHFVVLIEKWKIESIFHSAISKCPHHLLGDDVREIFEKRFVSSYFPLFIFRQTSAGNAIPDFCWGFMFRQSNNNCAKPV